MSTYECDPLAGMQSISHFGEAQFSPALTIDTSFMGTSDWAHSPSPMSPTTPDYLMTPTSDPVITASPYDGAFDAFDQPQLQKSFENFTTFPNVVDQSCVISHSRVDIGSDGVGTNLPLYGYNQQHLNLENLDLDFSALMNSIPQYAIWLLEIISGRLPSSLLLRMTYVEHFHYCCMYYHFISVYISNFGLILCRRRTVPLRAVRYAITSSPTNQILTLNNWPPPISVSHCIFSIIFQSAPFFNRRPVDPNIVYSDVVAVHNNLPKFFIAS